MSDRPVAGQLPYFIFETSPSEPPLEERVLALERLVLELTKHVPAAQSLPVGAIILIEELKQRHPDV